MFILKNLTIEAKRSNLILNCESNEANVVISENQISEANRTVFLKCDNIEAKRTGSIMILNLKTQKKANFRFFKLRKAKNERVR